MCCDGSYTAVSDQRPHVLYSIFCSVLSQPHWSNTLHGYYYHSTSAHAIHVFFCVIYVLYSYSVLARVRLFVTLVYLVTHN